MDRRDFLKLCGLAGLGFAAPIGASCLARAKDATDTPAYAGPYYVVFNASGGWDTTYLMDPKGVGGINRLYQRGDILTPGAHRFAPTAKHAAKADEQRGYSSASSATSCWSSTGSIYSVNNHTPCARYMATGKLDSLAYPTFAALVAACQGTEPARSRS